MAGAGGPTSGHEWTGMRGIVGDGHSRREITGASSGFLVLRLYLVLCAVGRTGGGGSLAGAGLVLRQQLEARFWGCCGAKWHPRRDDSFMFVVRVPEHALL